jgi:enamine deaminase RidA (YjgF/YER057c/UK114 family)
LTAHDLNGEIVGVGDAKAQAIQTFTNVKAVVEEAGSTLEDVVKVTVYVTNIDDLAKVAEARDQFFSKSPTASATVEVKGLAHKDMLIEVEAIAIARGG